MWSFVQIFIHPMLRSSFVIKQYSSNVYVLKQNLTSQVSWHILVVDNNEPSFLYVFTFVPKTKLFPQKQVNMKCRSIIEYHICLSNIKGKIPCVFLIFFIIWTRTKKFSRNLDISSFENRQKWSRPLYNMRRQMLSRINNDLTIFRKMFKILHHFSKMISLLEYFRSRKSEEHEIREKSITTQNLQAEHFWAATKCSWISNWKITP